MKPIEVGCLAVVTDGEFAGKECKALKLMGSVPNRPDLGYERWWEVEPYFDLPKNRMPFAEEKYLMRIDGYEELETEKKEITA